MKEKIMEALKSKFPEVHEAILEKIAVKYAANITGMEQIPVVMDRIGFQYVLNYYGDFRAGNAAIRAVRNYEKRYGLSEGKTIAPDPADPSSRQGELFADAILKRLDEMLEEKIQKVISKIEALGPEDRRISLVARIKDKLEGVDENYYMPFLEMTDISCEYEADSFISTVTGGWESFKTAARDARKE